MAKKEASERDTTPAAATGQPQDARRADAAGAPASTEDDRADAGTDEDVAPASVGAPPARPKKVLAAARSTAKTQYLVGRKAAPGVQPFDQNVLEANFQQNGIEIVKKLSPPAVLGAFAAAAAPQEIIVARMTRDQAEVIQQSTPAGVVIEPDHPVSLALPLPVPMTMPDPGVLPASTGFTAIVTVLGQNDTPVEGANVYLFGSVWPAQGITDANGQVMLQVLGETPESIKGLYVKPKADYWSFWLPQPPIDPSQENVVSLTPLDQTFPDFPRQQIVGWGQKAMNLERLPADHRGNGVRIGIIDSGAAADTHEDLKPALKGGFDTVGQAAADSWKQDTVMHGSHCAGIIAGTDDGHGIRGFAPAAEVFAYKIFPDGRFSNLIEALNHCIQDAVDVVNLSLGSDERSQLVEQKLQEAKDAGIACIVAAGNAGGPVQYPASSQHVLAVSAIGRQGVFPQDSYHSTTSGTAATSDGYFGAKFSCFGPEIGVCGPGVAIVSSVPPNNYAAWDGTSMATPHITGLAALVLAHHPDFDRNGGTYRQRNAKRVDRLFQILKESAQPINVGDRTLTGAGLPDASKAFRAAVTPASTGGELSTASFDVRPIAQPRAAAPATSGAAASTAGGAMLPELERLTKALEQAGLGPASVATASADGGTASNAGLQKLDQTIAEARLGNGRSGTASLSGVSPQGSQPPTAIDNLTATMREAGLS
jgi:subtilisin family serine protease